MLDSVGFEESSTWITTFLFQLAWLSPLREVLLEAVLLNPDRPDGLTRNPVDLVAEPARVKQKTGKKLVKPGRPGGSTHYPGDPVEPGRDPAYI